MEWKLQDTRKAEYDAMLKSAQDLELSLGSTQYRLYKLNKVREDLDINVKKWWDEIIKEMQLDPKNDYMITQDGIVKSIDKQERTPAVAKPAAPAAPENKPKTVAEL